MRSRTHQKSKYPFTKESSKFYKPPLVRVRWDKSATPEECNVSQLETTHMGEMDGGVTQKAYPDPMTSERSGQARSPKSRPNGEKTPEIEAASAMEMWFKWIGLALWAGLLLFAWILQALPQGKTVKPARRMTMGGGGGEM